MRKIIHIDMDCFFAAVEMRDNPALKHLPLAIGGSRQARGVISTCNYPARAYGVRSAMPTGQALKLCPQLTLLSGNMDKYVAASRQIRAIFARYTDQIEPLSLDEAYLDVTDCTLFQGSATRIADDIRRNIFLETGLTASAGVAPNKFLAKIASDENKPDGLFVITPAEVGEFVKRLPLQRLPGVGVKTAERLSQLGLHNCADIAAAPLPLLIKHFGAQADSLLKRSQGIDERAVCCNEQRKSLGVERTLEHDLTQYTECVETLSQLLPQLQRRLEHYSNTAAGRLTPVQKVGVKLKFSDFRQTTVEKQGQPLQLDKLLPLLDEAWQRRSEQGVRLIGLQIGLKTNALQQLSLPF
ncbi:MAG: DNA polymerase IV [Gammaproteobacteria bacterium]|nr:DNA polymerase IV [Gammaproteobacteria bacterium]MBU1553779.1 DNA polymerase IV [Gammaproteobacteria bacterium]MBU2072381.1 DNA polymerase IV [Gammaproteobacteria bacterium]MBU2184899.1 DNA polymerase IV [Gammaproteobacteria bacterium]MBU2204435.1 DNA polymerase IV [Gammaproteobacteria bacterium]